MAAIKPASLCVCPDNDCYAWLVFSAFSVKSVATLRFQFLSAVLNAYMHTADELL